MLEWIIGPFADLETFVELIYGGDEKYYGIFNEDQFGVVAQGMAIMQSISVAIILVSIIMAGMRISSSGINPSNRTYILEYMRDFLIVGLLFFNLSTVFEVMFNVNSWFVTSFASAKDIMEGGIAKQAESFVKQGVLGGLIIGLCMLGLWIWANFYYMMRTLTLILLTILSPLAVALYLIPQTKGILGGLFKEYAGTVFVQSIHAALYWVITSIAGTEHSLGSILLFMIFIPVSETIRSLLGLGGQMNDKLSKSAAMFGGAALMGVAASVKGALNGQTVAQALRSGAGQVVGRGKGKEGSEEGETSSGLLSGAGTDIGSTSRAERMLKAGEVFSKGGKAVFGAAGAIAGSPMGPMGSVAMSSIGFSAGGAIGGVAGRTGMATAELLGSRAKAGIKAGAEKFKGIKNAESLADEKLANTIADQETDKWVEANGKSLMEDIKERFPDLSKDGQQKEYAKDVAQIRSSNLKKARKTVGQMKSVNGQEARASELIDSTVGNLTDKWAENNKEQFMKDYDQKNPIPQNATEADIQKHQKQKNEAWNNAVDIKRGQISAVASNVASKLGSGTSSNTTPGLTPDQSFVNKEMFTKEVGNQVASVLGVGERESAVAVRGATSGVATQSLYSNKSVNGDYLTHQLARVKTNQAKASYINDLIDNKGMSKEAALQQWTTQEPKVYQSNLSNLAKLPSEGGLPKQIALDHSIVKGNGFVKGAVATVSGITTGAIEASGVRQISQFMDDTKLGTFAKNVPIGIKTAWNSREPYQNPMTAGFDAVGTGFKSAAIEAKNHVSQNVVEKQAGFRNAVAYGTGIVGGVKGYKAGATFAAGNTNTFTTKPNSLGFKWNPYNNAVTNHARNQVLEVSEISQMAQTVMGPNGEQQIANGAIQMVATAKETVLQVRNKAGQVQTVSRLASGDSSLKQGETIMQDYTIQDGQFTPTSNVYRQDSAGGKVTLNRSINVNPNKIVANRNTPTNPRMVQEVQSYNQLVDNGQYSMKNAMNDMEEIKMVVDRNRSYLVGTKGDMSYRISPYGPGDTRLDENVVIDRQCEMRNKRLVVVETENYTSSLTPQDLLPPPQPNKRNMMRRQNELTRYKSLVEPMR